MKSFVAILCVVAVAAAEYHYDHVTEPSQEVPIVHDYHYVPPHGQPQQHIRIIQQHSDISPEGAYSFNYETENGISHVEHGVPSAHGEHGPAIASEGQYSYTAPDGTPITVRYVADENGFRAEGAHLPVAPAIPEAIQRSIEYNRAHPEEDQGHQTQQTQQHGYFYPHAQ